MLYEQTDRPMKLTTPLGPNALLLVGLQGRECISQIFHFELMTAWGDKTKLLPFDQLLGKKVTVEISPGKNKRYFNGIVCKITQGERDENFTYYTLEVVPQLWLLDRKLCSRTFQHITVPDILRTCSPVWTWSIRLQAHITSASTASSTAKPTSHSPAA